MKRLLTVLVAVFALLVVATPASAAASWPDVRQGASGPEVTAIQHLLTARNIPTTADGQFGPATASSVRSFQWAYGLTVDGWVGSEAWPVLVVSVRQGDYGPAVRAAQTMLRSHGYGTTVDGWAGPQTAADIRAFQSANGLTVDGWVGPTTWRHLVGTTNTGGGGGGGGDYALPLPRYAASEADYAAGHWNGTRAVDLITDVGTPVYATQNATTYRFWSSSCGNGMRVEFDSIHRFTYCHLNSYVAGHGQSVAAGQLVAYSGDTGDSGTPHLHIQGMDDSQNVCPQPYLVAVYNGQTPPTVSQLPTTGCTWAG